MAAEANEQQTIQQPEPTIHQLLEAFNRACTNPAQTRVKKNEIINSLIIIQHWLSTHNVLSLDVATLDKVVKDLHSLRDQLTKQRQESTPGSWLTIYTQTQRVCVKVLNTFKQSLHFVRQNQVTTDETLAQITSSNDFLERVNIPLDLAKQSQLVNACYVGDEATIATLLDEGADPYHPDQNGVHPMTAAMKSLQLNIVEKLILQAEVIRKPFESKYLLERLKEFNGWADKISSRWKDKAVTYGEIVQPDCRSVISLMCSNELYHQEYHRLQSGHTNLVCWIEEIGPNQLTLRNENTSNYAATDRITEVAHRRQLVVTIEVFKRNMEALNESLEVFVNEAISRETKCGQTKPAEPKRSEANYGETKRSETNSGETKPGATKPSGRVAGLVASYNETGLLGMKRENPHPGLTTPAPKRHKNSRGLPTRTPRH